MSAYFAYEKSEINTRLITFSSPSVGDDGFKTWSDSLPNLSSWRVVLFEDIIPRLSYLNSTDTDDSNAYVHAGHLIHYSSDGPLFNVKAYYHQEGNKEYEGVDKSWGGKLCMFTFDDYLSFQCLLKVLISHTNTISLR